MDRNLRRSLVALATTLASLALVATPAAATAHTITITGGTLTLHSWTSTLTRALGGGAGAGCSSNLVADVVPDGTGQAGTIDVTAFASTEHLVYSSNHYVTTMTRLSSSPGTWGTPATGAVGSLNLQIGIQLRAAANNSSTNLDCATTGTVLCTLRMTFHLAGSYANGPLSTTGATLDLSAGFATVTMAIGSCQVPFSLFNGGWASVSGLTGTM